MPAKKKATPARQLVKHYRVRVLKQEGDFQRILISNPGNRMAGTQYLTIQDAEYLIGQLQRANKRAPRAR